MKALKYISRVTMAAVLCFTAASCTDDNDWSIDGAYDRLFGVNADKISIETTIDTATVTFQTRSDAQYYIMEVSTDSLTDDVPMGAANAKVYGEDGSITKSPATLTNLNGDTKYYFRMKSMKDGKADSKWVYYKDGDSFKTKAEQIFFDLTSQDITDTNVRLSWTAGAAADHIDIATGGEVVITLTLTDAMKEAGTATVSGLQPSTSYTATIYNGEAKRGELSFSTAAAAPSGDYKLNYDGSNIQEFLNAAAAQAQADGKTNYSLTVIIPAGTEVDFNGLTEDGSASTLNIPSGMAVTFFGAAGGDKPLLKVGKAVDVAGSHAYVKFQNLTIKDNGSGYFLNQSNAATVSEFALDDCVVTGFKTTFFRLQKTDVKTIGTLTLSNCIFDNIGSGYSFIHVDAGAGKGQVQNVAIENCTFTNICVKGKMFIYSKATNMQSISIKSSTFYNVIGNANYFVDFSADTYGADSFTIENCLFGKSADEATNKNIRAKVYPTVVETYYTTDFFKVVKGANELGISSASLFTDPDNSDFSKRDFSFKPGTTSLRIGDPRWLK